MPAGQPGRQAGPTTPELLSAATGIVLDAVVLHPTNGRDNVDTAGTCNPDLSSDSEIDFPTLRQG